jgi:starvation-inducible DNA-binding protein
MSTKLADQLEISVSAISGPQREKNHGVLQPVLSDLIAYGLIVKQLHWNIIGPGFRPIHLHLDEIYEDAQEAVDAVAERLSACGHSPNGRVKDVAENSELLDVQEGFIRDTEVLLLASERTRELVGLIRNRMDSIEDVDTVTADLLHQIVAKLEKHHWMLQAQRL